MPAQNYVAISEPLRGSRLVTALLLLVVNGLACAGDLKSPLARLDLKNGDGIVFFGDSITHQRLYTQYVEDYFYTRYPHMRLRLHNAGVSGPVAWEALERFADLWGPLNNITLERRKSDPNFTLIPDSVHPGPAGQVVMAAAIIHDLGLPRQVSSIRPSRVARDDKEAKKVEDKIFELNQPPAQKYVLVRSSDPHNAKATGD